MQNNMQFINIYILFVVSFIFFGTCPRYVKTTVGINLNGFFNGWHDKTPVMPSYDYYNSNELLNEIYHAIHNEKVDFINFHDIKCTNVNHDTHLVNNVIIIKICFIIGLLLMASFFEDKMIYCKILNYLTIFLLLFCIFTNLSSMANDESFKNMLLNDVYIIKGTLWGVDRHGNITQKDTTVTNVNLLSQMCIADQTNYNSFIKFSNYTRTSNFDTPKIFDIIFLVLAVISSTISILMRMNSCKKSETFDDTNDTLEDALL